MTQDEIIQMARESGLETQDGFSESVFYFAKLVAEKSIQPYLPYKEKIEAMERAYDAHFKKAME
jgi:hypothetical protein